jgi:Holliday junction resolvase
LEYRTKQALEKNGWLSMRSPASKTPVDILATKNGMSIIVQCKKTGVAEAMYLKDLQPFLDISRKYKAIPLLVYSFSGSPLYVREVTGDRVSVRRLDKHVELEKQLKIIEMTQDDGNSMIIG